MTKRHISTTTGKLVQCPAKKKCRNGASIENHISDDIDSMSAQELFDNYSSLREEQIASGTMDDKTPFLSPPKSWINADADDSQHKNKAEEFEFLVTGQKDNVQNTKETSRNKYSFIKEFKEQESQFEYDFKGFPKKFFNADLRGKIFKSEDEAPGKLDGLINELEDNETDNRIAMFTLGSQYKRASGRLLHSVSAPSDNDIKEEDIKEIAESLGAKKVEQFTGGLHNFGKNTTRAYSMEFDAITEDGTPITRYVIAHNGTQNKLQSFKFRRDVGNIPGRTQVTETDIRSLAGAQRIQHKTGYNLLGDAARSNAMRRDPESTLNSLKALRSLEDAQLEGQNFLAQKKYVKEHSGSVATALDDKKNVSKTAKDIMEKTKLSKNNGGDFSAVEIDSDVDEQSYSDFENAYMEVRDKLPKFPEGKEPTLRIRKLGKHSSEKKTVNGLYSPAHNAIVLDVNTSEAYVHEASHMYDLTANNSFSTSPEFREIVRGYSKNLTTSDPKRSEYLRTPTEVFARLSERWFSERKGIDNRLLNKDKFANDDYTPFDDPELKEKGFALLDKLYSEK